MLMAAEKTKHNWEYGILVSLKELKETSETVVWSEMKILLNEPIVEDPNIWLLEAEADWGKLDKQYSNCPITFYDKYLTIDLCTLSCTFQEKKKAKMSFFDMAVTNPE